MGNLSLEFTGKLLLGRRIRILQNILFLEVPGFQLNPLSCQSFKKCYLYKFFSDICEINLPNLLHYLLSRGGFFQDGCWFALTRVRTLLSIWCSISNLEGLGSLVKILMQNCNISLYQLWILCRSVAKSLKLGT